MSENVYKNSRSGKPVRVVFTGGHHTPALAVVDELLRARPDVEIHWIGHMHAQIRDRSVSAEYRDVTKREIPFYRLRAGRIYGAHLEDLKDVPVGLLQSFYYLVKIRPRLIVSFGGYIAAPVVFAGWILRIPSVTHEQTVVSGVANRFIARFAKKVFVSFEPSLKHFPPSKTVFAGNPIRSAVFESRADRFKFKNNLPVVYITGGKQGAYTINETVRRSLSELLGRYNIIHQTGSSTVYKDYQKLSILKSQLPKNLQDRYIIHEYYGEGEIGAVFSSADVVVSRAGANVVTELAALGKPAILIPIPWVSHNEQYLNAKLLEDVGAAIILPEDELNPDTLMDRLERIFKNYSDFKNGGEKAKQLVRKDAARLIAADIAGML